MKSNRDSCLYVGFFILVLTTVSTSGTTSNRNLAPAPITCEDATAIDCSLDGICSDTEFASLLCPVTCGRCSNLVADCSKPEGSYCLTHPDVCKDLELAVIMCPFLCGFCGNSPAQSPPSATTLPSVTPVTDDTPDLDLPMCPTCVGVSHTRDCLANLEVCAKNQVCKGTVDDWKLTMRCTSSLVCGFEEIQSTRNCTSGAAFAPHEHCTLCCHGDDCARDLGLVQEGLDKIPNVLHCPSCVDETDPRVCAERIIPCSATDTVCQIANDHGSFTAQCGKQEECTEFSVGGNNCIQNVGVCNYCCQTSECLTRALIVGPSLSEGSTSAQPVCEDADFFPCQFARDTACNDERISLEICPVTCGRCGDL